MRPSSPSSKSSTLNLFKKEEEADCRLSWKKKSHFSSPYPLPPYELAVWSTATVRSDYLITDGKNKYSVPFDLIGEEVHIRLTSRTIEAFFNGSRVASYPRETVQKRDPIVKVEHMPDNRQCIIKFAILKRKSHRDSEMVSCSKNKPKGVLPRWPTIRIP